MRMGKGMSSLCKTTVAALALFAVGAISGPSYAQVKPGDFITPDNADKVKDLVCPGVFYKVQHGMSMKVVPTERVDWPPPYKDATEKYSAQVRLSQDKRSVVGYVAGQPFPLIDANDPDVANKIVWNNVFRPITTDDYDLRFYDCDSSFETRGPQEKQIEYFQIGHYAGYDLVGRTEVEPLPIDPDFKVTGRYWVFGLYPLLAPQEIRGTGFIRWRYAAPTRGDDIWSLGAGSRRIRRVDESIMSSSTTAGGTSAHAWDPDHYSGFNPKTEQYNYKFLGEKNMLASAPRGAFTRVALRHRWRHQRLSGSVGNASSVRRSRRSRTAHGSTRSTPRPSSTWMAKCGLSRTSTPTIGAADCSAATSIGWRLAIVRFRTQRSPSIRSSVPSWLAQCRPMFSRAWPRCVTCRASRRPSVNAGTSTWARWIRTSSPPTRWCARRTSKSPVVTD